MNQSFNELWQCYQSTKFLMAQKLSPLLSFAIITAWNPLGENLSDGQNALLDRRLQNELIKKKVVYRQLIGTCDDYSHMEMSWAVALSKAQGVALGQQFQQLAIYYVNEDQLILLPCHLQKETIELGGFSSRVTLVSDLLLPIS